MVHEKSVRFRAVLRTAVRWGSALGGRLAALVPVVIIGLAIADSLHQKQCRGGASHKGESYEMKGERLTFLNTGRETNGEVLEMDVTFKPTAETNPLKWRDVHVHPYQEERFEVISGAVRFRVGDREQTLTAGQTIVGPSNVPHGWCSADGGEIRMRSELRPALQTDAMAASFMRARPAQGRLSMLQVAVIMSEFDGAAYPTGPRQLLLRGLVKVLAPVGRLLGYKAC